MDRDRDLMTRVLLVDDARLLAELEETPLGRSSFEIRVVGPNADLIRVAQELQPAAIILGEGECCPDALDICSRLRENASTRAIPVIYIGVGLTETSKRKVSADVFIPRPFSRVELREAIHRVLRVQDRLAVRRRVDFPVELEFESDCNVAVCRDLSLSGAFVISSFDLGLHMRGQLRFTAAGRTVVLPVEVVRKGKGLTGEYGFGLNFLGLDADTGAFLSRFVRTVSERRGKPSHEGEP